MSESTPRSRVSLWLIGAICAAPVIGSYVAYYFVRPDGRTNHGELLETRPLPDARLQLVDGTAFELGRIRGKWILLMVDTGNCGDPCRKALFTLRQLRQGQGKDMDRIERAWLVSDAATPAADLINGYQGTWIVRAAGSELLAQLPAGRAGADYIYVVDPLGNLVLRYPRAGDPYGIIKDLARLLKASRIG